MNKLFMGIDPGLKGGICLIDQSGLLDEDYLELEDATDKDVWRFIDNISTCYSEKIICCIEKIQAGIFGIKKSDSAKLYGSYRMLQMALTAADIPFHDVDAKVWQKEIGINKKKGEKYPLWKKRLKAKAEQMFPDEYVSLGTADALLIAEFCRRKHG